MDWRVIVFLVLFVQLSFANNWSSAVREGGGGFYLLSPDQAFQLSIMGYGQFLGAFYSNHYARGTPGNRRDYPASFSLRRTRLDMLTTVYRDFEFLVEVGTPTLRLHPVPAGSDFGVVEARLTAQLYENLFQLRVGKFVGPFSAENSRSSRALAFVERYSALNSLMAMGVLDIQTGVMIFGQVLQGMLNYYLAVFNGNGDSITNPGENNGEKEFQSKLVFSPHAAFQAGIGMDVSLEGKQTLTILDHAFVPYLETDTSSRRFGFEADLEWVHGPLSVRSEVILFQFRNDAHGGERWAGLLGGYGEVGYFVRGNAAAGVQPLIRFEEAKFTRLPDGTSSSLHSYILGINWFINSNIRNQLNYILEVPDGRGSSAAYSSAQVKHILMNQLQVKF